MRVGIGQKHGFKNDYLVLNIAMLNTLLTVHLKHKVMKHWNVLFFTL